MGDTDYESIDGQLHLQSLFDLLSKAHMLSVLAEFLIENEPPLRFNQLQAELECAPNTLSRRLEELTEGGFLTRRSYDEIPPRVEYEPTAQLYALEPVFRALADWMAAYGEDREFVETMNELEELP